MAEKKPEICLEQKYYRAVDDGRAEVQFICSLKGAETDESFDVKISHKADSGETLLYHGPITKEKGLVLTSILDQSLAIHGRIIAVLTGETKHAAALTYTGPKARNDRARELYGPRRLAPTKEKPKVVEEDKPVKKKLIPLPNDPKSERVGDRTLVSITNVDPHAVRTTVSRTSDVDITRAREFEPPSSKELLRNISKAFSLRLALGAGAITLAGGGILVHGYNQGVQDAKEVAHDAKAMSMIPIITKDTDGDLTTVAYTSSRPFIAEDIARWNLNSVVEHEAKNGVPPKQEDFIAWNKMQTVLPEEVQENGPLFYARKALVYGEDKWAEKNIGINPSGITRAITHLGTGGGGSSIHDQLCGAVWEQTGALPSLSSLSSFDPDKYDRKWREIFCGIGLGLGGQMEIGEVIANYFTYVYVGNNTFGVKKFAEQYWGITNVKDLTIGHQLVLAALAKRRVPTKTTKLTIEEYKTTLENKWFGKDKEGNPTDGGIKDRAIYMLKGLIEEGLIVESKEDILAQIDSAKPNADILFAKNKTDYEFINRLAEIEIKRHLKEEAINSGIWRVNTDGVVVAINPELQHSIGPIVIKELNELPEFARGTVFSVNEKGEYIGIFTGSEDGFDNQYMARRLDYPYESPGSIGKLMVAAALASKGYAPGQTDPKIKRAAHDLAYSSHHIAQSARSLGVDESKVKQLIQCYGEWRKGVTVDPLEAAVVGNWNITPDRIPGFLYGIMTGKVAPKSHLIVGEVNNGVVTPWNVSESSNAACAQLAYGNGLTKLWATQPLKGTMKGISIPSNAKTVIGKTGTANAAGPNGNSLDNTTNIEWAPIGVEFRDGTYFSTVTYIRAEKIQNGIGVDADFMGDMGATLLASDNAVPVANGALQVLAGTHDANTIKVTQK